MADDRALRDRYPDLFDDASDPALARLISALEAAYTVPQPPAALLEPPVPAAAGVPSRRDWRRPWRLLAWPAGFRPDRELAALIAAGAIIIVAAIAVLVLEENRMPASGNQPTPSVAEIYPVPASCPVMAWSPAEDRRGVTAHWLDGDGLAMGSELGVLFEGDNVVRWEAAPGTSGDPIGNATPFGAGGQFALLDNARSTGDGLWTAALNFAGPGCYRLSASIGVQEQRLSAIVYVYPAACRPAEAGGPPPAQARCEPPGPDANQAMPTPIEGRQYYGLSPEQAQQLLPFRLGMPTWLPPSVYFGDMRVNGPPDIPGTDQPLGNRWTVSLSYSLVVDGRPSGGFMIDEVPGEVEMDTSAFTTTTMTIGGVEVTKAIRNGAPGSPPLTVYHWAKDGATISIMVSNNPPITEADFERMIASMVG